MMKNFYSYPSIEQFRTVVKYVNDRCGYHNVPKPTLRFRGTVKLHGTNAAVVMHNGEVWAQSRNSVIEAAVNDNAGFAAFVDEHAARFRNFATHFMGLGNEATPLVLYGEWCGKGIQKKVGIAEVSKRFIVFGIRVMDSEHGTWYTQTSLATFSAGWSEFFGKPDLIDFIHNYPSWTIDVNFENPGEAQNKLVELTMQVEAECPVAKQLGVSGVGEGIVWVCDDNHDTIRVNDLIFKVKGAKHSDTRTKNLAAVDVELMNSINECAEAVCTEHRLEKGLDALKLANPGVDVLDFAYIGEFLKWVGQDVLKEESDMITASGLEVRKVTKAVGEIAKRWFKEKSQQDK